MALTARLRRRPITRLVLRVRAAEDRPGYDVHVYDDWPGGGRDYDWVLTTLHRIGARAEPRWRAAQGA